MTLFYGDKSSSMSGCNIELASTAFMELVAKARFTECDLQLALIGTQLEKVPIGKYDRKFLTRYVHEWQRKCGRTIGTKVWECVWKDVSSLAAKGLQAASVVMVTDGLDNLSTKEFFGPKGAHHLVNKLRGMNIQDISFNIVGIGHLPKDVSSVFENVSSLTGGLYHAIRDVKDLPAFSTRFVKPFAEAVHNPTIRMIRARERAVDAKLKVGIFDDQVADALKAVEQENDQLKKENNHLKAVVEDITKEKQQLKAVVQNLKDGMEEQRKENQAMKDQLEELKEMVQRLTLSRPPNAKQW